MSEIAIHERTLRRAVDPFDAYCRLVGTGSGVLLDGTLRGGELGRYAYVLFDAFGTVDSSKLPPGRDPLIALTAAMRTGRPFRSPGRFRGGAAGWVGYDLGRRFEKLPATALSRSRAPDLWVGLFDRGLEIDAETGAATLFVADFARDVDADVLLRDVEARLAGPPLVLGDARARGPLRSNFTRAGYCTAVEAVRELIRSGDIYQANLAQRFECGFSGDPMNLYTRLRAANPAPYAALVRTGDGVDVLSSSPERFLSRRGPRVETRPIKGTRRRGADAAEDARIAIDLAAAPKDGAELAMIVDLLRNDLGKLARYGSVNVVDAGRIESYATVLHRVAIIEAELREGALPEELLRAAFPGGSITGCPKIRAMEVIEELEGVRRGVYTGAIGWIDFAGDLELSIAIRTLVVEDGIAHFHAGGGIVLDSDPADEYAETHAKAAALARALDLPLPDGG